LKGAPQVRPASAGAGAAPLALPRRPRAEAHGAQPVPVDSRIAARRRAVAEEETRRRIRRLLWLAGPVALIAVVLGITRTPLLDVDRVVVASPPAGGAQLDAAEQAAVLEALAGVDVARGEPLVDVDLHDGEEALEALPWIDRAEVSRRWPGTLEVEVLRRVPVGAVATAAGAALVDRTGQVVAVVPPDGSPAAGLVTGLVELEGPGDLAPGDRVDADSLLAVAELVPDALVPMVARVGAGDGPAVVLHLREGGTVDLGPTLGPADVADKLHAAVTMLTQVDRTCLQVLDVSVPTVPTVTRVPGC
jgi:cell division protein FtsQ